MTGCNGEHLIISSGYGFFRGKGKCVIVPMSTDSAPSRWSLWFCSTRRRCRRRHLLRHLRLPDHLADPRRDARRALLTSELLRAPHPPHLSRAFPGACRLLGPGTVAVHAAGLGSVRPEFGGNGALRLQHPFLLGLRLFQRAARHQASAAHLESCDRRAILHRLSTHSAASPPLGWPALDRGRPRSLCFVACGFDPDHSG